MFARRHRTESLLGVRTNMTNINSSKFKVVENGGFQATYLSENVLVSSHFGSFRLGIDIAYGSCNTGSLLLGSISYDGHGTSQACSYIDVVANPNPPGFFPFPAEQTCAFEWYEAQPIGKLYVNPVEGLCNATCGGPVAIEPSTWGRVKMLYRR